MNSLEVVVNDPFRGDLIEQLYKDPQDLKLAAPKAKIPFSVKDWELEFNRNSENSSLLFKMDQEVVGHIAILPNGDELYLCYIILDSRFRGFNLAMNMLTQAEEFCRLNYFHFEVFLNVETSNMRARKLYEKACYKVVGEFGKNIKMKKVLRT